MNGHCRYEQERKHSKSSTKSIPHTAFRIGFISECKNQSAAHSDVGLGRALFVRVPLTHGSGVFLKKQSREGKLRGCFGLGFQGWELLKNVVAEEFGLLVEHVIFFLNHTCFFFNQFSLFTNQPLLLFDEAFLRFD